jgi:hypothetical protein
LVKTTFFILYRPSENVTAGARAENPVLPGELIAMIPIDYSEFIFVKNNYFHAVSAKTVYKAGKHNTHIIGFLSVS